MKTSRIIPTILVKSKLAYLNKIKVLEKYFPLAQIDVLNGSYVKNKSYYCSKNTARVKTPLKFEMHLMINNPIKFIRRWKNIDKVKRFIIHVETITIDDFIKIKLELKSTKKELALAISPGTSFDKLKPYIGKINYLLIMAVIPGKNGAKFLPSTFNRIKKNKKLYPKLKIGIDGGVTDKNAGKLFKAGADRLCSGSYIAQAENIEVALKKLVLK